MHCKNNIKLIMLAGLLVCNSSFSGVLDNMKQWMAGTGIENNSTCPDLYKLQDRYYEHGGSFIVKNPSKTFQTFTFDPPSISSGGSDFDLVSFEVVSKKEIHSSNQNNAPADVNGDVKYHGNFYMRDRKANPRYLKLPEIKVNSEQTNIIGGGFGNWGMPSMSDVKNVVQGAVAYPFILGLYMTVKAYKCVVSVKDKIVGAFKAKDDGVLYLMPRVPKYPYDDRGLKTNNGGFEIVSKKELIKSFKELSKEGLERDRYAFRLAAEAMGVNASKAMDVINEWGARRFALFKMEKEKR